MAPSAAEARDVFASSPIERHEVGSLGAPIRCQVAHLRLEPRIRRPSSSDRLGASVAATTRCRGLGLTPAEEPGAAFPLAVPPAGVEPATWWVETTCSIQLSYGGRPIRGPETPAGLKAQASPAAGGDPACHVPCWNGTVAVAQLVRAPGCGPGGRGFKSPRSPQRSYERSTARASSSTLAAAPLAQRQSNGLLIRRFRVRIPRGAPERPGQGPDGRETRVSHPLRLA